MAFRCLFACFLFLGFIEFSRSFIDFDVCSLDSGKLEVNYGRLNVVCGSSYLIEQVNPAPVEVAFPNADQDKLYTVVVIDPDAPSADKPKCRSWVHFIMANIKGKDLAQGISSGGNNNIKLAYNPPTPPKGSGYHRYIFFAFSQQSEITSPINITNRCHFDVEGFAKKHGLSEMPDAVNMFKTKQT